MCSRPCNFLIVPTLTSKVSTNDSLKQQSFEYCKIFVPDFWIFCLHKVANICWCWPRPCKFQLLCHVECKWWLGGKVWSKLQMWSGWYWFTFVKIVTFIDYFYYVCFWSRLYIFHVQTVFPIWQVLYPVSLIPCFHICFLHFFHPSQLVIQSEEVLYTSPHPEISIDGYCDPPGC